MAICLDGGACLLGALLILTLPVPWVLAAVFAAMIHEFCHLLAFFFLGVPVWSIRVGICGTEIVTSPLDKKTELICAAAGPIGSLALLLLVHLFPRIALCAALQGIFNLLPIFPLDGGRILRCLTGILLPERLAEILSAVLEKIALAMICILALLLCFSVGMVPLLIAGVLVLRLLHRKIPCKESKLAVQ